MKFEGFRRPRSNFYRLPNDWFDIWQQIRRQTGQTRILGALKVTEYVMKWTWGYGNYSDPVRLSWTDFQEGRRTGDGRRHDRGTGLSRSALSSAITLTVQVGLLERAGSTYLPRLMPPERDQDGFGFLGGEEEEFRGFASPEANYFVVPSIWTDLIADCTLETTILVVEYFFRHTWGWRGGWDEPCWMTEEEIAIGRRKQSGDRYDNGTGYSVRAVHDALAEAIRRGWLVWRRSDSGREYALHLEGMRVSDSGEFLGAKQQKASADPVGDQHSVVPPISRDQQVAALEQQVRRLTTLLLGLLRTLENAGFDVVNLLPGREEVILGDEEVVPGNEEVVPVSEEVVPVSEEVVLPCKCNTDTFSDTYKQTPAAANTGGLVAAVGVAAAGASLPEDLRQKLEMLGFRGVRPMQELLEAYWQDPTRIRWWIEHLAAARVGDPRAGGFLLQTVVREKAPVPPLIASPAAALPAPGRCSFCGGQGFVLADVPVGHPLHGQQIPCPRCSNGGGH